jgi:hypothetical protein
MPVSDPPAARAALDRISHGVGFDTTPIATALNWAVGLGRYSERKKIGRLVAAPLSDQEPAA